MCKSNNEPPKADLPINFQDIKFRVNENDVILCNQNKWMYENVGNEGVSRSIRRKASGEDNNLEENSNIKSLNKEIENKDNRIKELESKIKEIDDKIATMNKILNIDVSEQEYVKELSDKINKEKITE